MCSTLQTRGLYGLATTGSTTGTTSGTTTTTSPYASNYGYGTTAPDYSEAERKWYMQNGYGDPLTMTNGYYQGVTQDARNAYLAAASYADSVKQASQQYSSGLDIPSNRDSSGYGVTYTYAGDALGIPA